MADQTPGSTPTFPVTTGASRTSVKTAWKWIGLVVLLIIVAIAAQVTATSTIKKGLTIQDIGGIFGGMAVIVVLVERFTEIIITIWRNPKSKSLKLQVKHAGDNSDDKKASEAKLSEHRSGTQGAALFLGFTVSILVCCSGVGILGSILDIAKDSERYLRGIDILLTSGLIAGGSDAFHQFTAMIDTFFSENKKLLEK